MDKHIFNLLSFNLKNLLAKLIWENFGTMALVLVLIKIRTKFYKT